MRRLAIPGAALLCLSGLLAPSLRADEGMWTFDNPPLKRLQEGYKFTPSAAWLDKVRLASVRFMDGGSGSFVSSDGLMVTNHHVGLACIQNLSTTEKDYVASGYLAPSRDKEPACPGYEVNVLVGMEDVSAKVLGAVKPAMSDKEAREARRAAIAKIENECATRTKSRCDVVDLYQGSEFHLYSYKKYTDVRLVFAPEQPIAFFGGDPDNFTFPRHDLDIAFFRAYEDGKPVKPAAFLPWSQKGIKDGDLVFVSGHPGGTSRMETMAQHESERTVILPFRLATFKRRLTLLHAYAAKAPENERRAKADIFGIENAQKAFEGRLAALQDAKAMASKAAQEKELQEKAKADAELAKAMGDPWAAIAGAQKKLDARYKEFRMARFAGSRLLAVAGTIVQYVAETKKPNEVRLEEFVDANLPSLTNQLYSKAPIYDDLEELVLADQLLQAQEVLGKDNAFVKAALGGKTPAEVAKEAISGTKLKDVAARKALVEGGSATVDASTDPMIALARRIDPMVRELRKFFEDEVDAVVSRAGEKMAKVRWKIYGKTIHPDATFTLRLAYGVVKGYPAEGTMVAPRTTFHGLYDRSASFGNKDPWALPKRYEEKKGTLNLSTPLNFCHTADIIGGNSGSPTINREGEFVGIIFDSNIHGLAWDYFYTDEKARAVSVDAQGIIEALGKIYDAKSVVDELTTAPASAGKAAGE